MKLLLGKHSAVDNARAKVLVRYWKGLILFQEFFNVSYWLHRREQAGGASTASEALIVARRTTRRGRLATKRGDRIAGWEERTVTSNGAVWRRTAAVAVTVGMGKAPTERGRGTTRNGGSTRVGAEYMVTTIMISDGAAFAIAVIAR